MRFVTFDRDGRERAGILPGESAGAGDVVLDLSHPAYIDALAGTPPVLLGMIEAGLEACASHLAVVDAPEAARLRLGDVVLRAPLPNPPRIFGVAHNYTCALDERGMAYPGEPVIFTKEPSTVIGPGDDILLPPEVGGCTYEAELAVVIGRPCKDIEPEEALEYIAGYMNFNDISASEVIRADGNFHRGKNFPTFGPSGPFLATPDEIPDPQDLEIVLEVDGILRQRGSTRQMLFSVADLVSTLSRTNGLRPGDIIATGTPAGVAPVQTPPTWLANGARVTMGVAGLGTLENSVAVKEVADA